MGIKATTGLTVEQKAAAGGAVILPTSTEVTYRNEDGSSRTFENLYALLGVGTEASPEAIKAAWKAKYRDEKDDSNKGLLNSAKRTLLTDREQYDRMGGADMNEICPGLFLGALSAAANINLLRRESVSTVLTVATGLQLKLPADEFQHHIIDVDDEESQDMMPFLQQALDTIDSCMSSGKRILVHCFAGVSRSATIVLAFVMQKRLMPEQPGRSVLQQAFKFVKARRMCIDPNPGFVRQLIAFEECGLIVPAPDVYRPLVEKANPSAMIEGWDEVSASESRCARVEEERLEALARNSSLA